MALALLGAVLSGILLLEHHGEGPAVALVNEVCGDGATSGCETVARSPYSGVAGVPLAAIGLLFYLSLAALLGLSLLTDASGRSKATRLVLYAVGLAVAIDVVLLGIQLFAIKAFCKLCLATYAVNVAAIAALWPARRAPANPATMNRGEGRLVVAGWALCSIAIAAAVAGAETTLSYREARRAQSILGAPAAGSPAEAAQQAQAEVTRLKQILDDPEKRERYVTEKAVKDFEDAPVQSLDLTRTPFKGSADAPIRVVTYSDFLCPWCRALANGLKDFLPQAGGRVAIYYKNYPLDKACNGRMQNTVHEGACWLALGGVCAQDQNAFWPYHDKVFFGSPLQRASREDAIRLAGEAGLDARAFEACLATPQTRDRVSAEVEEGARAGVTATPTVFINGKKLQRVNDFLLAMEKESQRLGLPSPAQAAGR
jgi:protein-disulfide isomerase/uncharacterized membrane protein